MNDSRETAAGACAAHTDATEASHGCGWGPRGEAVARGPWPVARDPDHGPLVTGHGRRHSNRRTIRAFTIGLVAVLVLGWLAPSTAAQTTMQLMRWREFSYAKETKQVGGRMTALDAVNRTGFIVLGDGQFARLSSWVVHTTAPDGKEFYQGFVIYDFEDGSSILAKVDASGPPRALSAPAGGRVRQTGTITFIAGTNRFKGITGRGTITSWMPAQWDMYAEIDATYNLAEP